MKTPIAKKSTTSNSHSSKSFFNKSGEESFFSKSKEIEEPFFSPTTIQPKLAIGQHGDEQEADLMSERVVHVPSMKYVQTKEKKANQNLQLYSTKQPLSNPQHQSVVQLQPTKNVRQNKKSVSFITKELNKMEADTTKRFNHTLEYSRTGLSIIEKAKNKIDNALSIYESAFMNHEKVLQNAKKHQTANKSIWPDLTTFAIGFGASLLATLIPGAGIALMIQRAHWLKKLLTAKELRVFAIGTRVSSEGAASSLYGSTAQNAMTAADDIDKFKPIAIDPAKLKLKHYKEYLELYRALAILGIENGDLARVLVTIVKVSKEAELWKHGIREKSFSEIENGFDQLYNGINRYHFPIPESSKFQELDNEINKTALPSVREIEEYIWIEWLQKLYRPGYFDVDANLHIPDVDDSGLIDNDKIEFYLYDLGVISRYKDSSSMLGSESYTGDETDNEDTRRISQLAEAKWKEIKNKYSHLL